MAITQDVRRTSAGQPAPWEDTRDWIERAQALLSGSRMPLAEIARTVGFRTHSHFSTTFRRQAGVTPIQWRRLHSRSTAGHAEPRNASTPSPGDANKPAPKRGPNSAFFDP